MVFIDYCIKGIYYKYNAIITGTCSQPPSRILDIPVNVTVF